MMHFNELGVNLLPLTPTMVGQTVNLSVVSLDGPFMLLPAEKCTGTMPAMRRAFGRNQLKL